MHENHIAIELELNLHWLELRCNVVWTDFLSSFITGFVLVVLVETSRRHVGNHQTKR